MFLKCVKVCMSWNKRNNSYSALKWRYNTDLFLPSSEYWWWWWWWWWSDRIIPHKKPEIHVAIKQNVLANKTWKNSFEERWWKITEIRMYIEESIAHAEFGSDGDTKNPSATGSLSRRCQKHWEDDTASRSKPQSTFEQQMLLGIYWASF